MDHECRDLEGDILNLRKEFRDLRRMMEALRNHGSLEEMQDRLDRVEIEVSKLTKGTA